MGVGGGPTGGGGLGGEGGLLGGTPPPQENLGLCEGFFLHIDRVAIKPTETPRGQ